MKITEDTKRQISRAASNACNKKKIYSGSSSSSPQHCVQKSALYHVDDHAVLLLAEFVFSKRNK